LKFGNRYFSLEENNKLGKLSGGGEFEGEKIITGVLIDWNVCLLALRNPISIIALVDQSMVIRDSGDSDLTILLTKLRTTSNYETVSGRRS
jgi:hypothetical protein